MIHALLSSDERRPLAFYLAMEEYLACNYEGDYFFMWQVDPTVIIGRCQNPFTEVNIDFCREKGIDICRRRSGGGCVYADRNNIMISAVNSAGGTFESRFSSFCSQVAGQLRALGLDARATGRNDICIGERKVSGNAFYCLPEAAPDGSDRNILHGTMLFDADPDTMVRAITPSRAKLSAKGVDSVRSHITTVREHLPALGIGEFKRSMAAALCDSEQMMTHADIAAIESIAARYMSQEWIHGRYTADSAVRRTRIEGIGEFAVTVGLRPAAAPGDPPLIENVVLQGDFFPLCDPGENLLDRLRGVPMTRQAVAAAIADTDPKTVIAGLTREALLSLIISG